MHISFNIDTSDDWELGYAIRTLQLLQTRGYVTPAEPPLEHPAGPSKYGEPAPEPTFPANVFAGQDVSAEQAVEAYHAAIARKVPVPFIVGLLADAKVKRVTELTPEQRPAFVSALASWVPA